MHGRQSGMQGKYNRDTENQEYSNYEKIHTIHLNRGAHPVNTPQRQSDQ